MSIINGTGFKTTESKLDGMVYHTTRPIRINPQPKSTFDYVAEHDPVLGETNHLFIFPHKFPISSLEFEHFNHRGARAEATLDADSKVSKYGLQRMGLKAQIAQRAGLQTTLYLPEGITRKSLEESLGRKLLVNNVITGDVGNDICDITHEEGWILVANETDKSKTGKFLRSLIVYGAVAATRGPNKVNVHEFYARMRDISGVNYTQLNPGPSEITFR